MGITTSPWFIKGSIKYKWRVKTAGESEKELCEICIAGWSGFSGEIVKAKKPFRWKWGHTIQTKAKHSLCIVTMAIRCETERDLWNRTTKNLRGPVSSFKNSKSFFLFKSLRLCRSHGAAVLNNQGNWITLHSLEMATNPFPPCCLLGHRPHKSNLSLQDTSNNAQHFFSPLWTHALRETGGKTTLNRQRLRCLC